MQLSQASQIESIHGYLNNTELAELACDWRPSVPAGPMCLAVNIFGAESVVSWRGAGTVRAVLANKLFLYRLGDHRSCSGAGETQSGSRPTILDNFDTLSRHRTGLICNARRHNSFPDTAKDQPREALDWW